MARKPGELLERTTVGMDGVEVAVVAVRGRDRPEGISLPSGDQSGSSPALRFQSVTCRSPDPSALTMNSAWRFGRSAAARFLDIKRRAACRWENRASKRFSLTSALVVATASRLTSTTMPRT